MSGGPAGRAVAWFPVARPLTLVPAPPPEAAAAVLGTVWPALRSALDGGAPLAVLPAGTGPAAAARALLRPDEPLEPVIAVESGAFVTTGSQHPRRRAQSAL